MNSFLRSAGGHAFLALRNCTNFASATVDIPVVIQSSTGNANLGNTNGIGKLGIPQKTFDGTNGIDIAVSGVFRLISDTNSAAAGAYAYWNGTNFTPTSTTYSASGARYAATKTTEVLAEIELIDS